MSRADRDRPTPSSAERFSLAVSFAIVLGLVALVIYAYATRGTEPATIEVRPQLDAVRHTGGVYYLPVEITNRGDETAEAVWIQLALTPPEAGEREFTQLTLPFLAAGEKEQATVVFRQNPGAGQLITSISFLDP